MQDTLRSARAARNSSLRRRAQVIKALGHPTRLLFVEQLADGERCVCDLTEMAGTDISTVSRHLGVLKNAGILDSERRGQKVFYRLRTPCLRSFFDCIDALVNASDAPTGGCSP